MINKIIILIFTVFLTTNLNGQDKYLGEFLNNQFYFQTDTKLPIGIHESYDEDEGLSISIKYGKDALIETITIKIQSDTVCSENINLLDNKIK